MARFRAKSFNAKRPGGGAAMMAGAAVARGRLSWG